MCEYRRGFNAVERPDGVIFMDPASKSPAMIRKEAVRVFDYDTVTRLALKVLKEEGQRRYWEVQVIEYYRLRELVKPNIRVRLRNKYLLMGTIEYEHYIACLNLKWPHAPCICGQCKRTLKGARAFSLGKYYAMMGHRKYYGHTEEYENPKPLLTGGALK